MTVETCLRMNPLDSCRDITKQGYTRVLRLRRGEVPGPGRLAWLRELLLDGGLVAFPTETVYGLGASARHPSAIQRLKAVKDRPAGKPLTLHVADITAARSLTTHWSPAAELLAETYWPGPITLVLPAAPHVPADVTGGGSTVGIRVPDHPVALALLTEAGHPLAVPSANISGRVSPTEALHVLRDLVGQVDVVIDAGPAAVGISSTVIDLTTPQPVILRSGSVPIESIQRLLPKTELHPQGVLAHNEGKKDERSLFGVGAPRRLNGAEADTTGSPCCRPLAPVSLVLGKDRAWVHTLLRRLADKVVSADLHPGFLLAEDLKRKGPWPGPCILWEDLFRQSSPVEALDVGLRQLEQAGVGYIFIHPADGAGIGSPIWNRLMQVAEHIYRHQP